MKYGAAATPSPFLAVGGGDEEDTGAGAGYEGRAGGSRDSSDGAWHRGGGREPQGGGSGGCQVVAIGGGRWRAELTAIA